ncbi:MAG: hypothetical protein KAJ86_07995 [Alphaproteobacteria bacterium]|nr:hypothetical protein [Alphaproteobacteria bacterium]
MVMLLSGVNQANAMNMMVVVGSPQIQIIITQSGELQLIRVIDEKVIKVSNLELVASEHDLRTIK